MLKGLLYKKAPYMGEILLSIYVLPEQPISTAEALAVAKKFLKKSLKMTASKKYYKRL